MTELQKILKLCIGPCNSFARTRYRAEQRNKRLSLKEFMKDRFIVIFPPTTPEILNQGTFYICFMSFYHNNGNVFDKHGWKFAWADSFATDRAAQASLNE